MFYVGLDLGQAQDYTALAVIEGLEGGQYHGRHLERFALGTTYPAIVQRVGDMWQREPLKGAGVLIVDATGVGAPVLDMIRQAGLSAFGVYITGGNTVSCDGATFHVPKRDLISAVQVLLHNGRLKFAEGLPEVQTLIRELLAFRVKITADAHDTYGAWRDGAHDDLVLAVAMACWYAQRGGRPLLAFSEWGGNE